MPGREGELAPRSHTLGDYRPDLIDDLSGHVLAHRVDPLAGHVERGQHLVIELSHLTRQIAEAQILGEIVRLTRSDGSSPGSWCLPTEATTSSPISLFNSMS